jgi:hypothetical protein
MSWRNIPDADIVVSPVVESSCFRFGVARLSLRDLDPAAIRQVMGDACCSKSMTTNRGFNFRVTRAPANHAPDMTAQHRPEQLDVRSHDAASGGRARRLPCLLK